MADKQEARNVVQRMLAAPATRQARGRGAPHKDIDIQKRISAFQLLNMGVKKQKIQQDLHISRHLLERIFQMGPPSQEEIQQHVQRNQLPARHTYTTNDNEHQNTPETTDDEQDEQSDEEEEHEEEPQLTAHQIQQLRYLDQLSNEQRYRALIQIILEMGVDLSRYFS